MRAWRTSKLRNIYWVVTVLFLVPQAWSALQYLLESPRMTMTIMDLGYPLYFQKLLGVAKLLAVAAIITGLSLTLKEWAYAGLTFEACGAIVSHLSVHDPLWKAAIPLAFVAAQLTSFLLWKHLVSKYAARRRRYMLGERARELAAAASPSQRQPA
jgi:hypothetical protein